MKNHKTEKALMLILGILISQIACNFGGFFSKGTQLEPTFIPEPTGVATISLDTEVTIPDIPPDEPEIPPQNMEAIWIKNPIPGAQVSPAFLVQGESDPTFEQNLVIRILGEDAGQILETYTMIESDFGTRGNFSKLIELPTRTSRSIMVQVIDISAKDGSLNHLSSVVVFRSTDKEPVGPGESKDEKIRLDKAELVNNDPSGPYIQVIGEGQESATNILFYAICGDTEGSSPDLVCGSMENRITQGNFRIDADQMGKPGYFSIRISIDSPIQENSKLVIYSISFMNGAIDHAASRIIRIDTD